MDTNLSVVAAKRGKYRHHPPEFKRAVVEQSLREGASLARVALEHGINANQVFAWRKAYKEGRLGEKTSNETAFLPVAVKPLEKRSAHIQSQALPGQGHILIERRDIRLSIEGRPDMQTLHHILAALMQ